MERRPVAVAWSLLRILLFAATALVWRDAHATHNRGGYALLFDSKNADIASPILGAMGTGFPQSALTIEFWVRIVDMYNYNTVVAYSAFDPSVTPPYDQANELTLGFAGSHIYFWKSGQNYLCTTLNNVSCALSIGWTHYAVTWEGATGSVILYRNGETISAAVMGSDEWKAPIRQPGCFMLGQELDAFCGDVDESQSLGGAIDEFRLWNYARTPAQVRSNFRRALHSEDGLIANFNFDVYDNVIRDETGVKVLVGRSPDRKNELTYSSDRSPRAPTKPTRAISGAPLIGGGLSVAVVPQHVSNYSLVVSELTLSGINVTQLPTLGRLVLGSNPSVDVVAGANVSMEAFFLYIPSASFRVSPDGDSIAYITYDINNASGPVTGAVVRMVSQTYATAPNVTVTTAEDTILALVLGSSSIDAPSLRVRIVSLPTRGRLFAAQFLPSNTDSYESLDRNASRLVEIVSPQWVDNPRGVVMYTPPLDLHSPDADTPLASFTYAYEDQGVLSPAATVNIIVNFVNDAPVGVSANTTLSERGPFTISLAWTDVDVNFSPRKYFRIVDAPRLGRLYQSDDAVDADGRRFGRGEEIVVGQGLPLEFQHAHALLGTSKACGGSCESGPQNVLGKPDVYPKYGTSELSWQPRPSDGEAAFVELEYLQAVFPKMVDIYETLNPGKVVRVSTATTYNGTATQWAVLWSGDAQSAQQGLSRSFEPPLCPSFLPSRFVRIDLSVDDRTGIDSIVLNGVQSQPEALVYSAAGLVTYVPAAGIFRASGFDSLSFVVSDCEGESQSAHITIHRPLPPVLLDGGEYFLDTAVSVSVDGTTGLGELSLAFDPVVADALARFPRIAVNGSVQLSSVTIVLVGNMTAGLEVGVDGAVGWEGIRTPMLLTAADYAIGVNTAGIARGMPTAAATLVVDVEVGGYTYRMRLRMSASLSSQSASSSDGRRILSIALGLGIGGGLFALICVALGAIVLRGKRIGASLRDMESKMRSVIEYSELEFFRPLGAGTFGVVYLGRYRGTSVAIRCISPPGSDDKNKPNMAPSEGMLPMHSSACSDGSLDGGPNASSLTSSDTHAHLLAPGTAEPWSPTCSSFDDPILMSRTGAAGNGGAGAGAKSLNASEHTGRPILSESTSGRRTGLHRIEMSVLRKNMANALRQINNHGQNHNVAEKTAARTSAEIFEGITSIHTSRDSATSADSASFARSLITSGLWRLVPGSRRGSMAKVPSLSTALSGGEEFTAEVEMVCALRHPNLVLFMGFCASPLRCFVTELMDLGSLSRLLEDRSVMFDDARRIQCARQAARGMLYLHSASPPIKHGNLKAANLMVDSHWVIKVADFGMHSLVRDGLPSTRLGTMLWTAPEVLRGIGFTRSSDCYSFGITLWEIYERAIPFKSCDIMDEELFGRIIDGTLRPSVSSSWTPEMVSLMQDCWSQEPDMRPPFSEIQWRLEAIRILPQAAQP